MTGISPGKSRVGPSGRDGRQGTVLKMLGVVIAATLLVFSGCAKPVSTTAPGASTKATTSTAAPRAAPTGPYGDLRVALATLDNTGFDPTKVGNPVVSLSPMFDFFFAYGKSGVAPGIVEKWEVAPDGTSWTYYIRKGVKFHNGAELTADDVKFSLDRYISDTAFMPDLRNYIARVEKVDNYAVRIFCKGSQPILPYASTYFGPYQGLTQPKDYIEKNGIDYFTLHPVGSGPFKFVRNVPGDMLQYEANTSYWGKAPAFKNLMMIQMPEDSTRLAALRTGQADIGEIGLDSVPDVEAAGLKVHTLAPSMSAVVLWGSQDPKNVGKPTADLRVRQALSLAINRDEIRKTFFYGKAGPPFAGVLTEVAMDIDPDYWFAYGAKAYRYDLEEAKRLLKEAGYPDGFNIKFHTFAMGGAPYLPKLSEIVQGYWLKVGVKATVTPIDFGVFRGYWRVGTEKLPAPEIVGAASTWAASSNPGTARLQNLYWGLSGTVILMGDKVTELDSLIKSSMTEVNRAKRKEIFDKVIKITTDSYTAIPVGSTNDLVASGPQVDLVLPQPAYAIALYLNAVNHKK